MLSATKGSADGKIDQRLCAGTLRNKTGLERICKQFVDFRDNGNAISDFR